MKHSIAIATAKVKKRLGLRSTPPEDSAELEREIGKVCIGFVRVTAGLIGVLGLVCLIVGLIASGGPVEFLRHWYGAISGR